MALDNVSEKDLNRNRRLALAATVAGSLLANLALSGLNVALPAIQKSMNLSAVLMAWVPLSLMMAMAASIAPLARLSDIWGRRKMSLAGLLAAALGSFICALSKEPVLFMTGRIINGIGLAAVFTAMTALVVSLYPAEKRGRVLGQTIAAVYIGLSLGPFVCGLITDFYGWHLIFWISGLALVPPFILMWQVSIEDAPAQGSRFDARGGMVWALAISFLFAGLAHLQLTWGQISSLLGAVLLFIFIRLSLRSDSPLLDIRLFTDNRRFAFSSLAAFICYTASMGLFFLLSLYLQYIKGLNPREAGLVLMVAPVAQAVLTPLSGYLSDKIDAGILSSLGMSLLFVAIGFLAFSLDEATSIGRLMVYLFLFGVGFAAFSAPNSNAIMGSVPKVRVGQASGVIATTRLCGQISSIAITALVFGLVIGAGQKISPALYPDFLKSALICFKIYTAICFIGILASLARGKKNKGTYSN